MEPLTLVDLALRAEVNKLCVLPKDWQSQPLKQRVRVARDILRDLRERWDKGELAVRTFARANPIVIPTQYADDEPKSYPRQAVLVRNCLYSVYASRANDLWRTNVRQLVKRQYVFNGRCVACIAQDDTTLPLQEVLREFAGTRFEFILLPNDATLREVVGFVPLLLHVAKPSPIEATFYAHTKGNATDDGEEGAACWRNAMYMHLLDRWHECIDALNSDKYDVVGTHKMVWGPEGKTVYPSGLQVGDWHFAGTFYWFRNDVAFAPRSPWRNVTMDRYGAEAWPSVIVKDWRRGLSMFQLWGEDVGDFWGHNPYDASIYPPECRKDFV